MNKNNTIINMSQTAETVFEEVELGVTTPIQSTNNYRTFIFTDGQQMCLILTCLWIIVPGILYACSLIPAYMIES